MGIAERVRNFFAPAAVVKAAEMTPAVAGRGGWMTILEPFSGAWQRGIQKVTAQDVSCYSTVYACTSRISSDIGKLPFQIKRLDSNGIWNVSRHHTVTALLRAPNHYQTAAQFREAWILSKLQDGNTYALKRRNAAGAVDALYVLDPFKTQPMITESGEVFYEINYGTKNNLVPNQSGRVLVPASEIIHDREMALYHPLIGVSPLAAAFLAANKNIEIQRGAARFFRNGAQPGGVLTAPAGMSETDAQAVKSFWDDNFTGENSGKVGVIGADMKFVPFAFKAIDSQMVDQLRYSDEQICHVYGIPPFKVGIGTIPAGMKVDDLNQLYYSDALQARIEAMEDCLDRGLGMGDDVGVELNLEPLLRMDAQKLAAVEGALVAGAIKTPNEARKRWGLPPIAGGDSVYLQQQNYSLEALARRDQSADPFGTTGSSEERSLPAGQMRTKVMLERSGKRRARYNHDDGSWDLQLEDGQRLPRIRQQAA